MPRQPLIDFDALDLSSIVVPMEEVRKVCRQRGRLELLDGVLHCDVENKLIVGFKDVRADDWWAQDHIPGRPIFPGILMIEAGAQLCTYDFILRRPELGDAFVGYGGINRTRFRGLVEPDTRLVFAARVERIRDSMFTYAVQAFVERKLVFECEIMGVVV